MGNCLPTLSRLFQRNSRPPDITSIARESDSEHQQPTDDETEDAVLIEDDDTPVFYISPSVSQHASQLSEEEQIEIAKKISLIQQMCSAVVSEYDKIKECVICMIDFEIGNHIRYLPCTHIFHEICIDTWLMRNFSCPICMTEIEQEHFL